jgi:hypothetical protein
MGSANVSLLLCRMQVAKEAQIAGSGWKSADARIYT